MPHYRCTRCRIRLDEAGSRVELIDEGCPICLGPLSAVGQISELVGFRKVGRDDDLADASPSPAAHAPAELGDARLARAMVDALRSVNADDSFDPRPASVDQALGERSPRIRQLPEQPALPDRGRTIRGAGPEHWLLVSPRTPRQAAEDAARTWPEHPR